MENLKSPRGYFLFPTWARNKTSEESNETSEETNETSEEFFISHVGISKYPSGNQFFPTQHRIDMYSDLNYCNGRALGFPS